MDPIVQRMAAQAESRKRMMSETPDYSIKSVPSGASTPTVTSGGFSSSPAEYEHRASTAPQNGGLSRTATSDYYAAPTYNANAGKPTKEPNKLRKGSATMTSQILQMPFSNGTDPDRQKMRMPPQEKGYPSPQRSRDSGYASVARTSTMESPTQMNPNGPQDPELLRRHRQVNASLPVREDETSKGRAFSLPASQSPIVQDRAPSLPATPNTADKDRRDSRTYVSRLDPGPASSSFLSSPVIIPQVTRPKRKEVPSAHMRQPSGGKGSQVVQTRTIEPEMAPVEKHQRQRSASSKRPDEFSLPTPDASKPRESYYRRSKLEQQQQAKLASSANDPSGSPPTRLPLDPMNSTSRSMYTNESSIPRGIETKSENRDIGNGILNTRSAAGQNAAMVQGPPLEELQILNNQPHSTQTTPYETPKESQTPSSNSPKTSSRPQSRAAEPLAQVGQPPKAADAGAAMINNAGQAISRDISSQPPTTVSQEPVSEPAVVGRDVNIDPSLPLQVSTAAPETEFPYLDGIVQGPTAPKVSVLEGYKVNRRGHILDEEGDVIGELTDGEIVNCVRRKVNAQGEILNDSGEVVGHARPLPQGVLSPIAYERQETSGSMVDFYHNSLRSPISPATPRDRRGSASTYHRSHQSQQSNGIVERTPITAASDTNAFVFELDASVESQAVPVIDHSEIFSPFGGSQPQRNSRSATSLTETGRRARRQSNPTRTPSASQERVIAGARRNSKRFTAPGPMPGTSQQERPRSFSNVAKAAPKAVLGPTWESLLDTVPVSKPPQMPGADESIASPAPQPSVRPQASYAAQPGTPGQASYGDSNGTISGGPSKSRRASQNGVNPRASTHAPFAKSPLSSVGKAHLLPKLRLELTSSQGTLLRALLQVEAERTTASTSS